MDKDISSATDKQIALITDLAVGLKAAKDSDLANKALEIISRPIVSRAEASTIIDALLYEVNESKKRKNKLTFDEVYNQK